MAAKPTEHIGPLARLRAGFLPVCLAALTGCSDCDPKIVDVQIRPDSVVVLAEPVVGTGQSLVPPFRLQARLIDEDGMVRPDIERDDAGYELSAVDQYQLDWSWAENPASVSVPTSVLVPDGRYVDVDIGTLPTNQLPVSLNLRVKVLGERAEGFATIELHATPPTSGFYVRETPIPFDLPVIAVVEYDDGTASTPIDYRFGALVGGSSFPANRGPNSQPTRATAFRMRMSADMRTAAGVNLAMPTVGLGPEPRTLNVHVWLAVPDDGTIGQLVKHELRLADSILARNRVGIRVGDPPIDFIPPVDVGAGVESQMCARSSNDLSLFGSNQGGNGPDFSDVTLLNIVYVQSIWSSTRGFTCDHMPSVGGLIVMDTGDHMPVDLGHELGHALGLQQPNGHVDSWPEFKSLWNLNMMTDATGTWLRSLDQLTIGQAWWMNLSRDSWINIQLTPAVPEISCWLSNCLDLATGKDHLQ